VTEVWARLPALARLKTPQPVRVQAWITVLNHPMTPILTLLCRNCHLINTMILFLFPTPYADNTLAKVLLQFLSSIISFYRRPYPEVGNILAKVLLLTVANHYFILILIMINNHNLHPYEPIHLLYLLLC
jgi:hypothetical protein